MEIVADKLGFGERLGHLDGRPAMAATDVCDLCSGFELLQHAAGQGGKPCGYEVVVIAGPEKARDRAEHAAGLIAPGNAATRLESSLDLGLVVEHGRHQIEA